MKRFFTANITRTAICVVLLSVLPAVAIIAATGLERYNREVFEAQAQGERFVRSVAARQNQVAEVIGTLTQLLASLRDVRTADSASASALFRDLVKGASVGYGNILLLENDGSVVASALPVADNASFLHYSFLKKALAHDGLSVSNVVMSPMLHEPVLCFTYPAKLEGKSAPGLLNIALSLDLYDEMLASFTLPEGASVYFLDGAGAVAAAYPKNNSVAVGTVLDASIWSNLNEASGASGSFSVMRKQDEGRSRVVYRKFSMEEGEAPYLYLVYVRPEMQVHAAAKALQHRDLTLFVLVVVIALGFALLLSWYTVRRPWRNLLTAAERVAGGDLSTRVSEKGLSGEIGALAKEFNAMAQALDKRDRELCAARDYAELSRNAKSEFLANMSHEIRTSMNAILGMAYLVLKTELTPQQKGYVSKLLAAAKSLLRVINDILDFSKMEAGKLAMERIGFSLRRIASTVRSESAVRLSEKKLSFNLQTGLDVPDHLLGDPLRLSQALMILVDDAVNRSERGEVKLACALLEQTEDEVLLQFVVQDAGVGLTPVQLAELRELFDRDESEASSTMDKLRLRLAIGNKLFRMMGGRIEVASVFGEGVRFEARARFGYVAGEMRQPDKIFKGKKALIVDSSDVSCQDLVDILPRFGFAVECVANLDVARNILRKAENEGAAFSVLFVDWKPSAPDTPALVSELKAEPVLEAAPPVILTTGVGRAELPASLESLDIDALLPKPINESLVFDTLMDILGAHTDDDQDKESDGDNAGFAGVKILLAEDNTVNQQIAAEILEGEGVELVIAVNGEEAVNILSAEPPHNFDMVLMDLQMPKMDGFSATRAIRANTAFHPLRLPIVAMTAHSDVNEISACFAAGMNDYTGKPIIMEKFFSTLRRWLPVSPDNAEGVIKAVSLMRSLADTADPESLARLDEVLNELLPVLHEGRVNAMRAALQEGDLQAVGDMFDALTVMARGFLNTEEGL